MAAQALTTIADAGLQVVRSPEIHPDARRSGGSTALMAMAFSGAAELVSDLIQRGVSVNTGDDGFTALMYAAQLAMTMWWVSWCELRRTSINVTMKDRRR